LAAFLRRQPHHIIITQSLRHFKVVTIIFVLSPGFPCVHLTVFELFYRLSDTARYSLAFIAFNVPSSCNNLAVYICFTVMSLCSVKCGHILNLSHIEVSLWILKSKFYAGANSLTLTHLCARGVGDGVSGPIIVTFCCFYCHIIIALSFCILIIPN
jgi:hypothetical protein